MCHQVPSGSPAITTELDELKAQVAVLDYLDRHIDLYDGVIIGCFGDPGVNWQKSGIPFPSWALRSPPITWRA